MCVLAVAVIQLATILTEFIGAIFVSIHYW
jgi:hypothetical protein